MVLLVTVSKPFQDFNGLSRRRRLDHHSLETTFQGPILFDVFAEFIEGRGTNTLNFTSAQSWFQHIRSVDRSFCTTGTDQGVKFVDEQDRVLRPFHFIHDRLDSLFKLTTVFGSRHHHGEIQHNDPFVPENFGDFAIHHHLGKAFDDRGLADTRFSQQYGIILLSATKNLNHAFNLVRTPNDGVKFGLPGEFCQIASEAIQSGRLAFRSFPRSTSLGTARTLGGPFGTTFNTVTQ